MGVYIYINIFIYMGVYIYICIFIQTLSLAKYFSSIYLECMHKHSLKLRSNLL